MNAPFTPSRRDLLAGTGALIVPFRSRIVRPWIAQICRRQKTSHSIRSIRFSLSMKRGW